MLVLFDHGVPRGLTRFLTGHRVKKARAQGWHELTNGALLTASEKAGFDLLIPQDKNCTTSRTYRAAKLPLSFSETRNGLTFNSTWKRLLRS